MGNIGPTEIILLLLVVLLLFGAKRLPEIGKSLGSGMREFKNSVTGKDEEPAQLPPAQQAAAPVQTPAPPADTTPSS